MQSTTKKKPKVLSQDKSAPSRLSVAQEFLEQDRLQEAKAICEREISKKNQPHEALNLLGQVWMRMGKMEEAIACFHKVLTENPADARSLSALARILWSQGMVAEAAQLYESALQYCPNDAETLHALTKLYADTEQWQKAFMLARRALQADASRHATMQRLRTSMQHVPTYLIDQQFIEELAALVVSNRSKVLVMMSLQVLCLSYPRLERILGEIHESGTQAIAGYSLAELVQIVDIPLLHALCRHCIVPSAPLELLLTQLRRRMVLEVTKDELPTYLELLKTLAFQGYNNEYMYFWSDEEWQYVEQMRAWLYQDKEAESDVKLAHWLLVAAYSSWGDGARLSELQSLLKEVEDQECLLLFKLTVTDRALEQEIARSIPSLEVIKDDVSLAVQQQYEENPYPRWLYFTPSIPQSVYGVMHQLFPYFNTKPLSAMPSPRVLIAGCGTGQHALATTSRFRHAVTTAVDISRASLAYALRKTKEYDIENVEYLQADILSLQALRKSFDIVESAGVLHHMQDPMAGWRVLVKILKPGGLMKIGLYSAVARESITAVRKEILAADVKDSAQDIRHFRHKLLQAHEAEKKWRFVDSSNFYSLSECRDLLFHRQEHCFTIPQIQAAIAELGLKFIGFEITHLPTIEAYKQRFPEDREMNRLENWHALEQDMPDIFSGMYQFWCYKPL